MSREDLRDVVGNMRETARLVVARHAVVHAPHVPRDMVRAVCDALGDISIDEAMAALDRFEHAAVTGETP